MNEALQVGALGGLGYGVAIVVVADDISTPDQPRSAIARQQEQARFGVVPHAHVARAIDEAGAWTVMWGCGLLASASE